jgi:dCTP diphosphatase
MKELEKKLKKFVEDRDWGQYHSPKNLAIGISVEANELLDLFIWQKDSESSQLKPVQLTRIREEVGDVLIHLVNFCRIIGVDPVECAHQKLRINEQKYPVAKAYGSSKKYNEFDD